MLFTFLMVFLGLLSLIAFLIFRDKNASVLAILFKTLTSVFFVLTAVGALITRILEEDTVSSLTIYCSTLILLGLVFGLIGDVMLDFKVYFKSRGQVSESNKLMWVGMGSFGLGHIAYVTSIVIRLGNPTCLFWAVPISLVVAAIIMFGTKHVMKFNYDKFFFACFGYGFLLFAFVCIALNNMVIDASGLNIITFLGALSFILSDLVLSITYFSKKEDYLKKGFLNPESRFMISINHALYYAAQFLVAISILFLF